MSFGYRGSHQEIEDAIDRAIKKDKILIAAASNDGGNKNRARPAEMDDVLCVHACDGRGNDGKMNPSPIRGDNFTVLGVAIKSKENGREVFKSGTSFATPVAAAIAANILEFANCHCNLDVMQRRRLHRSAGMRDIFKRLSKIKIQADLQDNNRGGYDYVYLPSLWEQLRYDDKAVARTIEDVMSP